MNKLVVFKLHGDFSIGFNVTVEISIESTRFLEGKSGSLPPAPNLLADLKSWQQEYRQLGTSQRIKGTKVVYTSSNSQTPLNIAGINLTKNFQKWLRSESFQDINLWLRTKLNDRESIRMLLCTNNQKVHQLPWNQWQLLDEYPNIEIALSRLDFATIDGNSRSTSPGKVKILAIFGNNQNINTEQDLKIWQTCVQADIKTLIEPEISELHDHLWSESWDIVFFAGHSETIAEEGVIYLNKEDVLTIRDLEYAFKEAITNGLQLAIFNSCDGLGLAYALGQLGLSQVIVMREPIVDSVAHQFLEYFLTDYSRGSLLHLAIRRARERLQGIQKNYPFSSWLPVLYQNQSAIPLLWSELVGQTTPIAPVFPTPSTQKEQPNYLLAVATLIIVNILVWSVQSLGWLQKSELNSFDRAISLRPPEARDERILVITIDDEDIKYQQDRGMEMRWSLADEALMELMTKLQPHQPIAIASDLIHDFPYIEPLKQIIAQQDNFIGICRVGNRPSKLSPIYPPPGIKPKNTGFTNIAIDSDGVIRRHILGMTPDKICQSDMALSTRMALRYLDRIAEETSGQKIYPRQLTPEGLLKIGDTVFPKLTASSGAYQLPETENKAHQLILNYRSIPPQDISLRDILNTTSQTKLANLVNKKIIFIGLKSPNNDIHYTPYSNGNQSTRLPGVLIHAQASSQIISAVLDSRKLIRWFPNELELLWIVIWSLVGSGAILVSRISFFRKHNTVLIITGLILQALGMLYICYFIFLINGYWLPLIAPALGLIVASFIFAVIREQLTIKN